MPLTVKVRFDAEVLGEYCLRDGKIETVADTDAGRESLDQRLEMYARQMVEDHGFDPEKITAEDVLRWIPEHTAQGRNWTQLVEDEPTAP